MNITGTYGCESCGAGTDGSCCRPSAEAVRQYRREDAIRRFAQPEDTIEDVKLGASLEARGAYGPTTVGRAGDTVTVVWRPAERNGEVWGHVFGSVIEAGGHGAVRQDEVDAARFAVDPALVGQVVEMGFRRDPYFGGLTLRWGVLREITGDALIIDGYEDSAGISDGPCDGRRVPLSGVCKISAKRPYRPF